jgi:hypothetical protein
MYAMCDANAANLQDPKQVDIQAKAKQDLQQGRLFSAACGLNPMVSWLGFGDWMQCNLAFDSGRVLCSVQEEVNDMCIFEKYMSEEDFKQLLKRKHIVVSSIHPEMTVTGKNKSTNKSTTPEVYSTFAPNLPSSAFVNWMLCDQWAVE